MINVPAVGVLAIGAAFNDTKIKVVGQRDIFDVVLIDACVVC